MKSRFIARTCCLCLTLIILGSLVGCGRVGRSVARGIAARTAHNVISHSSNSYSEDANGNQQSWWSSWFAGGQDDAAQQAIESQQLACWQMLAELDYQIEAEPKNSDLYLERAYLKAFVEQHKQALADIDKAVELGTKRSEGLAVKHLVFASQGKIQDAFKAINVAIELDPESSDLYCDRGYSYEVTNDYSAALADYRKAVELDPNNGLAWNNLASVLSLAPDAEHRDGQKAVEAARNAVSCSKGDNELYCTALDTLSSALAEQGDFEQAIKVANEAIRTAPLEILDQIQDHVQLYQQRTPARYPRERSF